MRIAILFDNFGPYHLARLSAASRVADVLGVEFAGNSNEYDWERSDEAKTLKSVTLFPNRSSRGVYVTEFRDALGKVLDDFEPATVAIPGWSGRGAFLALEWCLRHRVPAVVMSESTAQDEVRSGWREWIKSRYVRLCSAALVGGAPQQAYLQNLGMRPGQIFQGYDAVDNDYFSNGAAAARDDAAAARKRHTLPEHYFLASARFVEKKNLSRLIDAYARYRELFSLSNLNSQSSTAPSANPFPHQTPVTSHQLQASTPSQPHSPFTNHQSQSSAPTASHFSPLTSHAPAFPPGHSPFTVHNSQPWNLVLLGDGPLRPTLTAQLLTLNLHDHVQMPGFVQYPDLPAYYGLAGIFIHASTTEQWGLVVNEAMASGLPVLVSNRCGCASDLVQEGINGFTFDPNNVEELAQLMCNLSTNNSQHSTFDTASRCIVTEWGPQRFAQGLSGAAEGAVRAVPHRAGWLDRLLLRILASR